MRSIIIYSLVVVASHITLQDADADVLVAQVDASVDTTFRRDTPHSSYPSIPTLVVQNQPDADPLDSIVFVWFDTTSLPFAERVEIGLTLVDYREMEDAVLQLLLVDESVAEETTPIESFPPSPSTIINTSGDLLNNNSNRISLVATSEELSAERIGDEIVFSSPELTAGVNSDTNGVVLFILKQGKENNDAEMEFASLEHSSLPAPSLRVYVPEPTSMMLLLSAGLLIRSPRMAQIARRG